MPQRDVSPLPTQPPHEIERVDNSKLPGMLNAFKHRNFRLYFAGLFISVLGVWAQNVAQNWLVYELTDSALVLGQVTFLLAVPVLLIGPWSGVIIDRTSRRNILIVTQIVLMIQAFILATLDFSGVIAIWHIMLLALMRGAANAFDAPTRQAIVVELVGQKDLSNGIALNSTMFSLARTFGPALGGLIVAALGTAWAFSINGITFLAILISLVLLELDTRQKPASSRSPLTDFKDGLIYIWQRPIIMGLLILAFSVAILGANYIVLMPVFAVEVLGRAEVEYGLLNGANGLGSVLGALTVTYISSRPHRGKRLNLLNILFPLALLLFAFTRTFETSLLVLILVGATFIPQLSLCNMLIQSNISDDKRGRVMSVYTLLIFGGFPLGGLISGAVAEYLGVPMTLAICAVLLVGVAVLLRILVPRIRTL